MKIYCTLLLVFISVSAIAQTGDSIKVVIVSCQTGDLYIDGVLAGSLEAEDARKEVLGPGEHYIQLKTPTGKISLTTKVDPGKNEIIKIGCSAAQPTMAAVKLIEKKIYLTGVLAPSQDDNLVGLDKDDQIVLDCSVLDKKGTANISVSNLTTGQEVYRKQSFDKFENERIRIPIKGIYKVNFTTNALIGKNIQFVLSRIAGPNSDPGFKTTVSVAVDTTFQEVLTTTTRVYSQKKMARVNRSKIKINLPPNTSYWAYWIGVDQKDKEAMKTLCNNLASAGKYFTTNPVALFGLKVLSDLPALNSTETITYKFMNSINSEMFVSGQGYQYYQFKHADNVSADYSIVGTPAQDLVLAMENKNLFIGLDVDIRVVAFVINKRWVMDN